MDNFPLRLIKPFCQILKWNDEHYGKGPHGGQFRPHNSFDDDFDEYDKYSPPKSTATRVYTDDPKDLVSVFKQFEKDGCILNGSPEDMAKKWQTVMPKVHPHEFLRAFFGKDDLTNKNLGQLQLQVIPKDKKVSFAATGDSLSVFGKKCKDYQRTFYMDAKEAYHTKLELDKSDQGGGLVKQLFKSIMPLYEKMGIEKIHLHANIDRGAYAWGKYGFEYNDASERVPHQKNIRQKLNNLTSTVELNPEAQKEKAALEKVLTDKSTNAIWALVDMKTPELDKAFKAKISKDSTKSNFIKLLTKETSWSGFLDMKKDSPSRKRLEQYIS